MVPPLANAFSIGWLQEPCRPATGDTAISPTRGTTASTVLVMEGRDEGSRTPVRSGRQGVDALPDPRDVGLELGAADRRCRPLSARRRRQPRRAAAAPRETAATPRRADRARRPDR